VGGSAALAVSLTACGSNRNDTGSGGNGGTFTMGTTDTVTAVDPAGSYDLGSSTLQYSIFQTLLTIPPGSTTPVGDAAQSCSYSNPQTFTCHLKPGLEFSNGDKLTSADVKYSFQRALTIKDPNGAAIYLLGDIASTDKAGNVTGLAPNAIDTPNPLTVIFHLNRPDVTFQYLITYPGVGAIVDQQVFPMDKKLPDDQVIGSGPYMLTKYQSTVQATLEANPHYSGDRMPKSKQVFISYYQDSQALRLAVQSGAIDVAWDTLGPSDLAALKQNSNLTVATGAGAAIRYWVWRVDRGPGKSLAVRQAAAEIIDRARIAKVAYDNTVTPLYSIVPPGLQGSTQAFKDAYGASPNVAAAKKTLQDAGVTTPVNITLGYTPTHYGPNAVDEAQQFQRELEATGLFNVTLKDAEWTQYQTLYKEGAYDLWMLGWYPDYPDADDYLSPFLVNGGFFQNGYNNPQVNSLASAELATTDQSTRDQDFAKMQQIAARDVPFIPSWVGNNTAVYDQGMQGVKQTLDPAYIFRLWTLSKSGS
jgi:peptide/nickel transport system substrate-binding protein